ncbi:MAG TPA: hypothetical protein VFO89_11620 [Thermoanaerobaculia bacterium]|nr:hypothetical protein [Thermoanaerobaculia bacterium]
MNVRLIALCVLALLGAPVAMHLILHDLHDHPASRTEPAMIGGGHDDHEHPVVASPPPQIPSVTRAALPVIPATSVDPAAWVCRKAAGRNALSLGALRIDDDVGLQPLLSTFLI